VIKSFVNFLLIKDPIPVKPWTGVLNANQEGSPCVQIDCILFKIMGNEDCLKLNVFTPVVRNGESSESMNDVTLKVPIIELMRLRQLILLHCRSWCGFTEEVSQWAVGIPADTMEMLALPLATYSIEMSSWSPSITV
jgi:hypothetical protein